MAEESDPDDLLGVPPFIATCWTSAGDTVPGRADERSPHDLGSRVEAAAAAGFRGFGLHHVDLEPALRAHGGFAGVRELFAQSGIEFVELEVLGDYWNSGSAREASDQVRRRLLDAAEALGAFHVKTAPPLGDGYWDLSTCGRELAVLADEFDQLGAKVSLEFFAIGAVRTLSDARAIVEAANRPNAGVMLDSWHVFRGGASLDEIAALPADVIAGVELDDGSAEPFGSPWEDTTEHRRLPGQGDFDLPGLIQAVQATGWSGPWGVEILSDVERVRPLGDALTDAYEATAVMFDAGRIPPAP